MLIKGIVKKSSKKLLNDLVMRMFPNVEQVGFYSFNRKKNSARLEMAGGEFCGNALRSLAYMLLKGKKGEITIAVSGTKERLRAGVKLPGTAYAQMPINSSKSLKKLRNGLFRIDLGGITQLVCLDPITTNDAEQLKTLALDILNKENLIYSVLASGVMFIEQKKGFIKLKPVVWVRDIETILYETACASGTAAVGIWKAFQSKKKSVKVKVLQPSGKYIKAQINKKGKSLIEVFIDGEVEVIQRGGEKL